MLLFRVALGTGTVIIVFIHRLQFPSNSGWILPAEFYTIFSKDFTAIQAWTTFLC